MIELAQGQRLRLVREDGTPLGQLRLGLGWDKERNAGFLGSGAPHVDLDATAVQFAGDQLFDLAFYNNLATRDGSVVHLGDNRTGDGAGDDEVVAIDLTAAPGPLDKVVFVTSIYDSETVDHSEPQRREEGAVAASARLLRADLEAHCGRDLHGPRVLDNLKGSKIWRFDPATAAP